MAERAKHWIKLWVSWLTTPAHLELSEGAFGLGPLLLLLATWDGEYDSGGWLLAEDGSPMSREAMARATHRERKRLDSQLSELVRCKTLSIRDDGALGFPHFGHWQETRNAKYNRTARKAAHGDAHDGAHSVQDRGHPRVQQTVDGRRETTELATQATPPTPASGGRKARRKKPDTSPDVAAVLDAIDAARADVGLPPLSPSQRDPTTIAARLAKGATFHECLAVVAAFRRLAQREPDKRSVLNASTPFTGPSGTRPGGWAWGMGMVEQARPGGGQAPQRRTLPTAAEIQARRAAEAPTGPTADPDALAEIGGGR